MGKHSSFFQFMLAVNILLFVQVKSFNIIPQSSSKAPEQNENENENADFPKTVDNHELVKPTAK
jgi:uncharacterized protein YpmS